MYRIKSGACLVAFEMTVCIIAKQTVLVFGVMNRFDSLRIDLTLIISTFSADNFSANRLVERGCLTPTEKMTVVIIALMIKS